MPPAGKRQDLAICKEILCRRDAIRKDAAVRAPRASTVTISKSLIG
jgi:hypothetical protein